MTPIANATRAGLMGPAHVAALSSGATRNFTASGEISTGQVVVFNDDRTVAGVNTNAAPSFGAGTTVVANGDYLRGASAPGSSEVFCAVSDGVTMHAKLYSISAAYGITPVASAAGVLSTGHSPQAVLGLPANTYAVLSYGSASLHGKIFSTASGTIGSGAETNLLSGEIISAAFLHHGATGKLVVIYSKQPAGNLYGRVIVLTGTSITVGAENTIVNLGGVTIAAGQLNAVYDSGIQRVVVYYSRADQPATVYGSVLSLSDDVITATTPTALFNHDPYTLSPQYAVFDPSTAKTVHMGYVTNTQTNYLRAIAATVGGAFSASAPATVTGYTLAATSPLHVGTYAASVQRVVMFAASTSSYSRMLSIAGAGPAIESSPVVYSAASLPSVCAYVSGVDVCVFGYRNTSTGGVYLIAGMPATTTAGRWIGVAAAAAAHGQSVPVTVLGGFAGGQSGMTPGAAYWLTNAGGLTTTDLGSARYVGRAISPTEIQIVGTGR